MRARSAENAAGPSAEEGAGARQLASDFALAAGADVGGVDSTESATGLLTAGAEAEADCGGAAGSQSAETETETGWSRADYAAGERLRLVFGEHARPLVSSRRKETYRARYVDADGANAIPVVATFFSDRRAFEKEFEKLELANSLGVGPRVFDVCHREKPQVSGANDSMNGTTGGSYASKAAAAVDVRDTCSDSALSGIAGNATHDAAGFNNVGNAPDNRPAFPCLVEEDLGVSLADMIGEGAAAPHIEAGRRGVRLAPVGSAERTRQVAKIAFDIGAELTPLHEHGAFYLDLKPSNVCVRAYGNAPTDIRAGLIDFESLVTSSRPSDYSTLACYNALSAWARAKGVAAPMLTNQIVDLGFLLLVTASTLCGKAVGSLRAADIDAVCSLPGMGFFAIRYSCFDVRPLSESDLAALAEAAGMTRAQSKTQALPRPTETNLSEDAIPESRENAIPNSLGGEMANSPNDAAAASSAHATPATLSARIAASFPEVGNDDRGPTFGRFGFCDTVDKLHAAQNPLYVLAKRKFDIALACHGDWCNTANASRSDLIRDFFAQDPVKIKQGLRQADGILSYVERLGCALVPKQLANLPRYRARRVRQLSCGQMLLVAQWEHESWRALHEQLGFRYAERNADGTRPAGANEYLLTWENLCETPETDAAPLPAGAPRDAALAKLWDTRARNDIAFACGIVAKLQSIGLAVINETYRPPSR